MPALSPRETQTLEHLARGLSYKQAAAQMGISTSSVREYLVRAKTKLNQSTTHETILAARQLNLIVIVLTFDDMTK